MTWARFSYMYAVHTMYGPLCGSNSEYINTVLGMLWECDASHYVRWIIPQGTNSFSMNSRQMAIHVDIYILPVCASPDKI